MTRGQGDKETRGQGDRETRGQGDKGIGRQKEEALSSSFPPSPPPPLPPSGPGRAGLEAAYRHWRIRTVATLWITYASFYLCRVNMSVALPEIMRVFGYSKVDVGAIGSAMFIAYGVGQLINGLLGDRVGARAMMSLGLTASALLNLVFGFSSTLGVMMVIWGLNGYVQSMGWSPSVKAVANWFPPRQRGRVSGIYGSSFQIGIMLAWLLGGYAATHYGWRYVFWIPSCICLFSAVHTWFRLRNAPEEVGLPTVEEYEDRGRERPAGGEEVQEAGGEGDTHLGFAFTLKQTAGNSRIWRVGLAEMFLSVVSYGFIYWLPTYLVEARGIDLSGAAAWSVVLPLSGCAGAWFAGWASDRFFEGRRAPVPVLLILIAAVMMMFFPSVARASTMTFFACLFLISFTNYGAQVLIVTTMAMDFGTRKAASSAAGFIDALGYGGAVLTGIGTGWVVQNYGWSTAFYGWAISAFVGAALMGTLWTYRPERGRYR